jgi:hypothetical protein
LVNEVVLSEITKKEITRVLETTPRIKAKQIRKDLNKRGYIIRGKEAKLRVKELVARYRKKKKKVARIGTTKSEWMEFINKIGPIDLNRLDKPYVVDMKWPEEKGKDFCILLTTPRGLVNLRRQIEPGVVCHSYDGTHVTNDHNYPLITVAALDKKRSYFAGAFAIASSEKKENMVFVYEKIQEEVDKYKEQLELLDFDTCSIIADAHESYKNATHSLATCYNYNASVQMCYFHVTKAIKNRKGVMPYWNGQKTNKSPKYNMYVDIKALHQIPSGMVQLFRIMEARFLDKWKKVLGNDFVNYYNLEWKNRQWSRCYTKPAYSTSNNATEAINAEIKDSLESTSQYDIGGFVREALEVFKEKSHDSADKIFVNHETPREIKAFSWRCLNEYAEKMSNQHVECAPYGEGYLFASKPFVSAVRVEAENSLRYQATTSRLNKAYDTLMESKRAEFIKYWELASTSPEKLNKKDYTFDKWREISSRFHVVVPKTNHHIPSSCPDSFNQKGQQIMKHYHDCKWYCTCTREENKQSFVQAGYQNSEICDHVMYTGIYKGGMIRPSDEEDTMRVNKTTGRRKQSSCYTIAPVLPPAPKKTRMYFGKY